MSPFHAAVLMKFSFKFRFLIQIFLYYKKKKKRNNNKKKKPYNSSIPPFLSLSLSRIGNKSNCIPSGSIFLTRFKMIGCCFSFVCSILFQLFSHSGGKGEMLSIIFFFFCVEYFLNYYRID